MRLPSSILMIFAIIINGALVASQQASTDSCASNVDLNAVGIPFDTASLNCLSVWDSQNFILRFAEASANVWSFVLSARTTTAYIAMGFSSNGQMVGSSAVVGWISSNGSPSMKQYALNGQSTSQVKADQGTLSIVNGTSLITSQNNRTYLAFQLNAAQPQSRIIYSIGPSDFTPTSAAGFTLVQHRNQLSTRVNYASGQSTSGGTPYQSLRNSHGMLNIISWGILMIIGAIAARYFRDLDPLWFYAHTAIQSTAFVLGLIGIITGLVLEDRIGADVSTHKGIGIFIFVLGCLQLTAVLARPDISSKVRKYWNWYHHNAGRLLFIFAVANIFYGIHLGKKGSGWNAGYGIVLALFIISIVALEIRMHMKK